MEIENSLFLAVFDQCSLIIKNAFDCHLPGVDSHDFIVAFDCNAS